MTLGEFYDAVEAAVDAYITDHKATQARLEAALQAAAEKLDDRHETVGTAIIAAQVKRAQSEMEQ